MVRQHGDEHDIPKGHRFHKHGSWLPADFRILSEWLKHTCNHVDKLLASCAPEEKETLRNPVLQEFKELIEGNPRLFMYFSSMFTEIPRKAPYDRDPTGTNTIRDYKQMLRLLDHVFGRAPEWTDSAAGVGMVGVPLAAVLDYPMATPSGHAAFLDPEVNRMLKRALNEWGKFLTTPESAKVLEANQNGWFGEVGPEGHHGSCQRS